MNSLYRTYYDYYKLKRAHQVGTIDTTGIVDVLTGYFQVHA